MHDIEVFLKGRSFADIDRVAISLINLSPRLALSRSGYAATRFVAHFPSIGLLNIAEQLRNEQTKGLLKQQVFMRYFDEEEYGSQAEMGAAVESFAATSPFSIIASSTYSWSIREVESFYATFDPTRHLLMVGGAHATLSPQIANCHISVRGEGMAAVRHIVNSLGTDTFFADTHSHGICFVRSGKYQEGRIAYDRSLETTPTPCFAYDLLPERTGRWDAQFKPMRKRALAANPAIYVCTQSCRARCSFCSTYLIHGKFVSRPIELVRQDLQQIISKFGFDSIEFHDDDLCQHREFGALLEVLQEMRVPWFAYMRAEHITPELASRLRESGCRKVFLGVEAMRQEKLDYFNKKSTVEENIRAVTLLDENDISVIAGFIIGAPMDTEESIGEELRLLMEIPVTFLNCSVLVPDPWTLEYRRAILAAASRKPALKENTAAGETKVRDTVIDIRSAPSTSTMDPDTLQALRSFSELAFHLRVEALDRMLKYHPEGEKDSVFELYEYWLSRLPAVESFARKNLLRNAFCDIAELKSRFGWKQKDHKATEPDEKVNVAAF